MDATALVVPGYIGTMMNLAFLGYFLCAVGYGVVVVSRRARAPWALRLLLYVVNVQHAVALCARWYLTGRPPFISLFEMVIFIAWAIPMVWIWLEMVAAYSLVGCLSCGFAALALAYSNILDQTITPLVPALQSNWLTAHIFAYLIGYAAASVAFVMALLYLAHVGPGHRVAAAFFLGLLLNGILLGYDVHSGRVPEQHVGPAGMTGLVLAGTLLLTAPLTFFLGWVVRVVPGAVPTTTDLLNRLVGFTFPFLTIGIVTGAVWAEQAWGVYWSWDNKENWSLVTWGVYATYLHAIYVFRWRYVLSVYLVVVGFVCMMITWLGVNYLSFLRDPLHSYASSEPVTGATTWGLGLFLLVAGASVLGSAALMVWIFLVRGNRAGAG